MAHTNSGDGGSGGGGGGGTETVRKMEAPRVIRRILRELTCTLLRYVHAHTACETIVFFTCTPSGFSSFLSFMFSQVPLTAVVLRRF